MEARIGEDIILRVIEVRGQHVKFQIEAPASVIVDRAEVRERKRAGI